MHHIQRVTWSIGRRIIQYTAATTSQEVICGANQCSYVSNRFQAPMGALWRGFAFQSHPCYSASQVDAAAPNEDSSSVVSPPTMPLGMRGGVDPFSLVADELTLLGERMRKMVISEVPRLATAADYFFRMGASGKRFRPAVLLLMASAMVDTPGTQLGGVEGERRVLQQRIAEITEMIHVASLLHDDVLDHADTRRGVGSLNFVMGNKLAVLAGDFLLARASSALASLRNTEVVELLSQVLEHLVAGEIMQMSAEPRQCCSMDYYLQKNFLKTASLMANSCKAVAVLGGQPETVAELAFSYGRHLGLAFQLVDDALDFTGSLASLGKPALSDLKEGLATAPVLFAAEEHPGMLDLIKRKFKHAGDVDQALAWVRASSGIRRTHELAAFHSLEATKAIQQLPFTTLPPVLTCRQALIDLTQKVLSRSK